MSLAGAVSALWRYPVSSLAGEALAALDLDEAGVAGDRIWGLAASETAAVADPDREKRWRPVPMLQARTGFGGPEVRAGDGRWITLPSLDANAAASAFMGFPAAYHPHVGFGESGEGTVAPRYKKAPIHLLTSASLAELARLVTNSGEVDARRFRPNIVIETEPGLTGFVEKSWIGKRLAIGGTVLAVTEPCARCSFTALAQAGLAFEPQILQKVAAHGGGGFGIYCDVVQSGRIALGEVVSMAELSK